MTAQAACKEMLARINEEYRLLMQEDSAWRQREQTTESRAVEDMLLAYCAQMDEYVLQIGALITLEAGLAAAERAFTYRSGDTAYQLLDDKRREFHGEILAFLRETGQSDDKIRCARQVLDARIKAERLRRKSMLAFDDSVLLSVRCAIAAGKAAHCVEQQVHLREALDKLCDRRAEIALH